MNACGQRDPVDFDVEKGFLHLSKHSPGSWEGECHQSQFAKDTLFHALKNVLRPLDRQDTKQRKEVL